MWYVTRKTGKTVQPSHEFVRVVANRERVARAPVPLVVGHVLADNLLPSVTFVARISFLNICKRVERVRAVIIDGHWIDLSTSTGTTKR